MNKIRFTNQVAATSNLSLRKAKSYPINRFSTLGWSRKSEEIAVIREAPAQIDSVPFTLLGTQVEPGCRATLSCGFPHNESPPTSIIVVHGNRPGPVLCVTAGIHGDELNGIEITRLFMQSLTPDMLCGTVVGIPIVNLEGFRNRSRYLKDGSDLNRYFPGQADGTYPDQFAYAFFTEIVAHCDALIDLHTGSSRRENLPQLRADLTREKVAEFSSRFNSLSVLHSTAPAGSLRAAATAAGIPAVVAEIGGSQGLEPDKVVLGMAALQIFLNEAGLTPAPPGNSTLQHIYLGSGWIRAEKGGILVNKTNLGDLVQEGDALAEIIDPLTCAVYTVVAPFQCTILGRVHNQVVEPGYSLFRVGIES